MRKYEIRNNDDEGCPVIDQGESTFYYDDEDLVPDGFCMDEAIHKPDLRTVYVRPEE